MAINLPQPDRKAAIRRLHILLVLSFINTGLYLLSETLSAVLLPTMTTFFEANPNLVPDEMAIMIERSLNIPQWYYLLTALLDIVSIIGLIKMWNLRQNGFHYYTLSKLLLILLPILFLDRLYVGIGNIMIAVLMIVYYWVLMRGIQQLPDSDQPEEEQPAEQQDQQ